MWIVLCLKFGARLSKVLMEMRLGSFLRMILVDLSGALWC